MAQIELDDFRSSRQRHEGSSREVAALYRIASLGLPEVDEGAVLAEILRITGDIVACEEALLCLYEKETDQMVVHSSTRDDTTRVSMAEPSVLRRVFETGRGELVNDLLSDLDSNPSLAHALDARQVIAAPLVVARDKLGVLLAVNSTSGAFTDDDLRLLTLLAERSASAVENIELKATLERQSQEIEGLHRLSRLQTSAESVDRVIEESVRIVCDLLDCRKVALLLYDQATDALIAHPRAIGLDESQVADLVVPLSEPTLSGTAFRTDTTLVSNEARSDAWVHQKLRERLGIERLMVIPLNPGGGPIGVLKVMNSRKSPFDENDKRFGTLLGSRIASVIESSRARERERALVQRLREADQTKSEFVSMLAHELKGPMTSMKGYADALREQWDSLPPDKRNRMFDIMTRETERLSRLVNDLLDMSRMEAGTLRYDMEPISPNNVVDGILSVHPSLNERHSIVTRLPTALPRVVADADRIKQVLLNLLTNATRYSPEGTTVTIGADVVDGVDGRRVLISVADEGIGIAADDQKRLFSKFVDLPKPAWVKKGTGLGLYVSKGIVEAHGGDMWIDSEKGRGSTFFFTLPAVA